MYVAEANVLNSAAKVLHLAVTLRGNAADILVTISEDQHLDFESITSAHDLLLVRSMLRKLTAKLWSRITKQAGETLQKLAMVVERLTYLAYLDYPAEVRENLTFQYFIDKIWYPVIQKAFSLVGVIKYALAYGISFQVYASKLILYTRRTWSVFVKDSHNISNIRTVSVQDSDFHFDIL